MGEDTLAIEKLYALLDHYGPDLETCTVEQLRASIEHDQETPVLLRPHPMQGAITGFCNFVEGVLVAFFRADGTHAQQVYSQVHELLHIGFGHVTSASPRVTTREILTLTPEEREVELASRVVAMSILDRELGGEGAVHAKMTTSETPTGTTDLTRVDQGDKQLSNTRLQRFTARQRE